MKALGATLIDVIATLLRDLSLAARSIRTAPRFAVSGGLTLMLGIGATATMFSVADAVFLQPLDYRDASRLYVVRETLPTLNVPVAGVNALHFQRWRDSVHSFDQVALLEGFETNLSGLGEPARVSAARVSGPFFRMLGVDADIGRTFREEEERPGHDNVVVLSHDVWLRQFGGDGQVVGRTIGLNGRPHTVVGVLPKRFAVPKLRHLYDRPNTAEEPQVWTPFALSEEPYLAQM